MNQTAHAYHCLVIDTAKQFSNWACKTLTNLFGKPLTLTGLRHSFLSSLEWSALSRLDRKEIACSMAHSVDQQELYRLISLSSTLPNRPWQLLQPSGTKLTTAMSKQVYILQPPDSWGTCKWWSGVFVTGSCKRLFSWLTHTACIMTYVCCHIYCMATNTEYCTRERCVGCDNE